MRSCLNTELLVAGTGDRGPVVDMMQFVGIGELVIAKSPVRLLTVLGSCVAVCLWSPIGNVGGMNHYLLPYATDEVKGLQYGSVSLPHLITAMRKAAGNSTQLRAVVVGGSSLFSTSDKLASGNVEVALEQLGRLQIPVLHSDVGGRTARRVVFDLESGEIQVSHIKIDSPSSPPRN
jgi:chemotaxis protein CheD